MTKRPGQGKKRVPRARRGTTAAVKGYLRHVGAMVNGGGRAVGRPRNPRPGKDELLSLYRGKGLSVRDCAAALGTSKDIIARTLAEYGITRRPHTSRRSRLAKVDRAQLFSDLVILGGEGTAAKYGLTRRALLYYQARLRNGKARRGHTLNK